jgi:hypothetical protein
MAKKAAKKTAKPKKKVAKRSAKPAKTKASTSRKAAAKRAARLKAIEAAQAAEATAATTVNYAPPPFDAAADPSKAPGHQHRHPPESLHGVKHSEAYISKARTPFNRRQNIGR